MKVFTQNDVQPHGAIPGAGSIYADSTEDFAYSPLGWQRAGLSQTATGYGAKLATRYLINFSGKLFRLYNTCYGNASSTWFITKGKKIFVN
jgi:hypothetical protein